MRQARTNPHRPSSPILGAFLGILVGGLLLTSALAGPNRPRRDAARPTVRPAALQQAPRLNFDGAVDWINSAPLRASELRGKIVLLDFWTFCCINCHHVLPDLAKLEQKYGDELVVIGVHTAKFFAERDTENIRQKVHEYQIKHPVINDADQVLWNNFGVTSWPTLVLFDPQGVYQGSVSGEGHYAALDRGIASLVAKHRAKGDLNLTPVKFFPESEKSDSAPLSYPGKVLVDEPEKRLFISDTAHNRLVLSDLNGGSAQPIGDGQPGFEDGDYAKARFNRPQGMCVVDDTLYVADTENHALRAIDLKKKKVKTVAGTGQQSHRHSGAGPGRKTGLNSPWDVILIPGTKTLAIAMAGIHQIWRYDIGAETVDVWAGTGAENIEDGPVKQALFAQPSGLATDGTNIYVADSEVSAIRSIGLGKKAAVHTIVGSGLFVFADRDGRGDEVRLQHCLGVAFGNGKLYIADSYNNKIKVCNPAAKTVETLLGSPQAGQTDDPPRFYQPGGLSVAERSKKLYVADTNNHKIRVVDLRENTVISLELEGLKPPAPKPRRPSFPNASAFNLDPVKVAPDSAVELAVSVPLPAGFKLNDSPETSVPFLVETPDNSGIIASDFDAVGQKQTPATTSFSINVPFAKPPKAGDSFPLKVSLSVFVCNEKSNFCMIKSFVWNIPVTVAADGAKRIVVTTSAPAAPGDGEAAKPADAAKPSS